MSLNLSPKSVSNVYVSLGCNREPSALDWSHTNSLVAYGGSSIVAIYNPTDSINTVVATLRGHKSDINCVKWINNENMNIVNPLDNSAFIGQVVSGGFDGKIIVWDLFQQNSQEYDINELKPSASTSKSLEYRISAELQIGKTVDTIINISTLRVNNMTFIAGCASSGLVHIWLRFDEDQFWNHHQTLHFSPSQIMQSAAFSKYTFEDGQICVLFAVAGVDTKIHVLACTKFPTLSEKSVENDFFPLGTLDGHIDWVRSLSFCTLSDNSLLLSSSAQDKCVRIWKLNPPAADTLKFIEEQGQINEEAAQMIASSSLGERGLMFACGEGSNRLISVHLETVLIGHEEWVLTAQWKPVQKGGKQEECLLTASADKTMMMWQPDSKHNTSLWANTMRVGEAGGNTLGLFSACFSPDGNTILGLGYSGCFHMWKLNVDTNEWECLPTISGHNKPVVDIYVSNNDSEYENLTNNKINPLSFNMPYIVSASADQSTKIHAPLLKNTSSIESCGKSDKSPISTASWYEIARPQVHGWDLTAIAPVPGEEHEYICASEEKLMRVFKAPVPFIGSLYSLSSEEGISDQSMVELFKNNAKKSSGDVTGISGDFSLMNDFSISGRALSASQPELTLSNKAFMEGDHVSTDNALFPKTHIDMMFVPMELQNGVKQVFADKMPIEDELISCSLWPEIDKLYGHGYDLSCIATCSTAPILASASHARNVKNGAVRLWDTRTWTEISQISGHDKTITQMMFTPGNRIKSSILLKSLSHPYFTDSSDATVDKYLVSVSRDMQYAIYRRNVLDSEVPVYIENGKIINTDSPIPNYVLTDLCKAHTRQIYAMGWVENGNTFFTSSRDKSIKIWSIQENNKAVMIQQLTVPSPVTAFAGTHTIIGDKLVMMMIAGLESGSLRIFTSSIPLDQLNDSTLLGKLTWEESLVIEDHISHSNAVTKIAMLPNVSEESILFATSSNDHSTRLFSINL